MIQAGKCSDIKSTDGQIVPNGAFPTQTYFFLFSPITHADYSPHRLHTEHCLSPSYKLVVSFNKETPLTL